MSVSCVVLDVLVGVDDGVDVDVDALCWVAGGRGLLVDEAARGGPSVDVDTRVNTRTRRVEQVTTVRVCKDDVVGKRGVFTTTQLFFCWLLCFSSFPACSLLCCAAFLWCCAVSCYAVLPLGAL